MQKKKILYINKDGVLGGSALSLYLLLQKIKAIHNVYVILGRKGPFYYELKKLTIPVYFINFRNWRKLKYVFKNIAAIIKLKRIIKKVKPDIIHSNSYEVNPLMVLSAGQKIKTICHVRDMITSQKAKKFLLPKTNTIIAISKAVKKQIQTIHNNIKVIYNSVDVIKAKESKNNLNKYIKLNKKIFKIGIIGNCEPRKQQEIFIQAALLICSGNITDKKNNLTSKKKPDFHFLIIGNNKTPYGKKIKEMIKGYTSNFSFINHVDNIYDIIRGLDAIVITSKEEAFGRTAIEAMICRKPVIGTNTGGIPEIVIHNKTGLLFEVGDYKKLANHILFLQTHKKTLIKFGINGYNRVLQLFTLKRHIAQILKLYNNLI